MVARPPAGVAAYPSATGAKAKLDVDLHQHPTGGKNLVDVSIGLYVTNIVAIDETRETFEIGGYLTAKWQDPRLKRPADRPPNNTDGQNAKRTFRVEDLWTPPIEAENSISYKTNSYSLEADAGGLVTYIQRFDAVLSNQYAFRKFPFDTQVLRLKFQPFLSSDSGIQFASEALSSTGISPEQHTELAGWRIKEVKYSAEKPTGHAIIAATREAFFQIVIQRRSGFYLWKIFLPLLMMAIIPMVAFWLDPKEFDWMLKVPMTMLLSMVAFEFAIVRDLPRIGYVTFLDAVFIASFTFCFLCILEITTVFHMQKEGMRSQALKIHSVGRWAYPVVYLVVLLFLAVFFLA